MLDFSNVVGYYIAVSTLCHGVLTKTVDAGSVELPSK